MIEIMLLFTRKRILFKAIRPIKGNICKIIRQYDINFSIGPAGTGKTYLAVASAVDALESGKVKRVLLVRPAVELEKN